MLNAKSALAAVAVVGLSAGLAGATDVSAKKLKIKVTNPAKQQVQLLSKDPAINLPTGTDKPTSGGASLHVYDLSLAINECFGLSTASWQDKGTQFKYKDASKNSAQIKEDKFKIKLKGAFGIGGGPFGDVNAIFRSSLGSYTLCMKCSGAEITKDEDGKYSAKNCAAKPCDLEVPPPCLAASPSGAFLD